MGYRWMRNSSARRMAPISCLSSNFGRISRISGRSKKFRPKFELSDGDDIFGCARATRIQRCHWRALARFLAGTFRHIPKVGSGPVFLEQIRPNMGPSDDSGTGGCATQWRVAWPHCSRLARILAGTFWTILAAGILRKVPAKIRAKKR